jgi:hypothetical protein
VALSREDPQWLVRARGLIEVVVWGDERKAVLDRGGGDQCVTDVSSTHAPAAPTPRRGSRRRGRRALTAALDRRTSGLDLDELFDYGALTRHAGEVVARLEEIA